MIARVRACLLTALCVLGLSGGAALGADIKVMSGGAPKEVLAILIPEFEKKTGHKVQMTYIVINAMQQKLAAGEKPDMVLMPVPGDRSAREGRHVPRRRLGRARHGEHRLDRAQGRAEARHRLARLLQESDARREIDRARQSRRDAERRAFREGVGSARHRGCAQAEAHFPQCARRRRLGDLQRRGRDRALSAERGAARRRRERWSA